MTHFDERGIRLLPWPPSSPDANPIENLWSLVKRRLKSSRCSSKSALIAAFIQVWNHDEEIQQMCKKLIQSMPDRIEAILASKGGSTRY